MEKDISSIINALEIKDDLDNECCRQPSLYMTVNMLLADADFTYETANKRLDQLKASKYIHYKTSTASKVTDATTQAAVTSDLDVIEAERLALEAKRDKNVLFGLVRALDQKKDMLKSLSFMRREYRE